MSKAGLQTSTRRVHFDMMAEEAKTEYDGPRAHETAPVDYEDPRAYYVDPRQQRRIDPDAYLKAVNDKWARGMAAEEETLVPQCWLSTVEGHARGLQQKIDALQKKLDDVNEQNGMLQVALTKEREAHKVAPAVSVAVLDDDDDTKKTPARTPPRRRRPRGPRRVLFLRRSTW